jgi:broad specificity phosphatase PhoE
VLVLLRHGQSSANAAGLLTGRGDVPLTEVGRRQAAALASSLGPVTRLISSPLARARDTAALLSLEVEPEIDERWIEIDYGELEGRPLGQLDEAQWRRWRADPGFRPAGGETLAEVGLRVRAALDELFAEEGADARDPSGDVVVVSHVSPIKAAVAWALGAGDGLAWRLQLSTGSLTKIGWGAAGPLLHTYNAVPSLVAG